MERFLNGVTYFHWGGKDVSPAFYFVRKKVRWTDGRLVRCLQCGTTYSDSIKEEPAHIKGTIKPPSRRIPPKMK